MKFIVTGGAGFIGSAFIALLNEKGINDIVVVDNLAATDKWLNLRSKKFQDYFHKDSFLKLVESGSALPKYDCLIHMGACSSTTELNLDYLMHNNYHYSKVLAQHALKNQARFVYASSAATYGDGTLGYSDDHKTIQTLKPLNPYGYSKNVFDQWAFENQYLDKIAGLRFFNVYGPNEYHKGDMRSVVHKSWGQIKNSGSVSLFKSDRSDFKDGEQKRDFIYVKDCATVMWNLSNDRKVNGLFNLGTGKARTWNDLVTAVFTALKLKPNIKYIDMPDALKGRYQYFTQAEMGKLNSTSCSIQFSSLEQGVFDYVSNYLEKSQEIW